MNTRTPLSRILLVGAFVAGCASGGRSHPESPQRVRDSAPDKIAAQRSAAGLHLEEEDNRWGIDAARELKQQQKEQKAGQHPGQTIAPAPAAPPSGGAGPATRQ